MNHEIESREVSELVLRSLCDGGSTREVNGWGQDNLVMVAMVAMTEPTAPDDHGMPEF